MSKLIGTAPNQVPSNADLGTMAYQDYDVVAPQLMGGRRNMIINGDMRVAQRGTSQTGITAATYLLDRWKYADNVGATVTMSQSTDAPNGFKNSLKIETTGTDTDLSGSVQYGNIGTRLEGQDVQHLAYGTSDAKPLTLSFWVKSTNPGIYASELESGTTGVNVQTWTINSANTWEYKTVTFDGWTSNSLPDGTGVGLYVTIAWFAAGDGISGPAFQSGWRSLTQTERLPENIPNLFGSVGNSIQITGCQLEVGTIATPFEHRSYGEELALCQRYFQQSSQAGGNPYSNRYVPIFKYNNTGDWYGAQEFPVPMRSDPTMTTSLGSSGTWGMWWNGSGTASLTSGLATCQGSRHGFHFYLNNNVSTVGYGAITTHGDGSNGYRWEWFADAEL